MNTRESHKRNHSPICAVLYLAGYSWFGTLFSPAWSQETQDYKPEFQKVVYRSHVPATIQRLAKKVGPTRFFGLFHQGKKTFAVHFYDTSGVRRKSENLERDSCLDVFELTAGKAWQRIQTLSLTRQIDADARRDRLRLEAQALWLDPGQKTIPMIYLKIMEHENREAIPVGMRIDIYGVLPGKSDPKAFLSLNGFIPYSNSTVTLSQISYPDAKGQLTILAITSNPGDTSYTAYGWTGEMWKRVGTSTSENGYEKALRWNGIQFVPLTDKRDTLLK